MDELHGRLLWTTLPSTGDFTDCGVIVHVDYPFLGNSVQTALIAMDDSLDEQELGSFFCFPIKYNFGLFVYRKLYIDDNNCLFQVTTFFNLNDEICIAINLMK